MIEEIIMSNSEMSTLLKSVSYITKIVCIHLHRKNRSLEGCMYIKMNTVVIRER